MFWFYFNFLRKCPWCNLKPNVSLIEEFSTDQLKMTIGCINPKCPIPEYGIQMQLETQTDITILIKKWNLSV